MRGRMMVVVMVAGLISGSGDAGASGAGQAPTELTLSSGAFNHGQPIPSLYTCDGQNISPPLTWSGVPDGTKSLALIADDPDAPAGTFVHWVVYSIPPSATGLQGGFTTDPRTPDGTQQGKTGFGRTGCGGPCPPSGPPPRLF